MPSRPGLMRSRCSLAAARKLRVVALSGTCWGGSAATVTGWPSATIWNCGRLGAAVTSASFTCRVAADRNRAARPALADRIDGCQIDGGRRDERAPARCSAYRPSCIRGRRVTPCAAARRVSGPRARPTRRIATLVACSGSAVLAHPRDHRARRGLAADDASGSARTPARVSAQHRCRARAARSDARAGSCRRPGSSATGACAGWPAAVGGLLPRRGHQRFLMFLDDARAERRDARERGSRFELVEPVGAAAASRSRAPRASDRTAAARAADRRCGATTAFWPGALTIAASALWNGAACRSATPAARRRRVDRLAARLRGRASCRCGSDRAARTRACRCRSAAGPARRARLRLQRAHQRFEIAAGAGAEFPVVVAPAARTCAGAVAQRPRRRERIRGSEIGVGRSADPGPPCDPARRSARRRRCSRCSASSNRGHISRDSDSCGAPPSALHRPRRHWCRRAAACACAHAQQSRRSGSSSAGFAGAAICSVGSGASTALPSVTPSCLRTTTRHSHGRSCAFAFGARRREQPREVGAIELDGRESSWVRSRCCRVADRCARSGSRRCRRRRPDRAAAPDIGSGGASLTVSAAVRSATRALRRRRACRRSRCRCGALPHPGQETQVGIRTVQAWSVSGGSSGRARAAGTICQRAPPRLSVAERGPVLAPGAARSGRPRRGRPSASGTMRQRGGCRRAAGSRPRVAEARRPDAAHRRPRRRPALRMQRNS